MYLYIPGSKCAVYNRLANTCISPIPSHSRMILIRRANWATGPKGQIFNPSITLVLKVYNVMPKQRKCDPRDVVSARQTDKQTDR